MRSSLALLIAVTLVAAGIGVLGCADGRPPSSAGLPGRSSTMRLDKVHLLDLEGRPHNLASADDQSVTVVVFTRTDCPISNRYAPEIRQLSEKYSPRGVKFYLIYVDPREQPDAIRAHLTEYQYPCPALRDPEHTLVAATSATVTPEAVVFAADWKIIYRGRIDDRNAAIGQSRSVATKHDLADAIAATLAGRRVAEPITTAVGCYISDLK